MVEYIDNVINNHITNMFSSMQSTADNALLTATYNASDVLNKLKLVDGASSGLDIETLDGLPASEFLVYRGDIGNTENLNDFNTGGIWHQQYDASTSLARNYPIAKAVMLTTKQFGNSYVYQEYQTWDNENTFQRTCYVGTWYPWKRIITGNEIGFSVHGPGAGAGPGAIILPHVRFNSGNMYNPSTGVVTIQKAGVYEFHFSTLSHGTPGNIDFIKNGSGLTYSLTAASNYWMNNISYFGPCAVGDYFYGQVRSASYSTYTGGNSTVNYNRFFCKMVA